MSESSQQQQQQPKKVISAPPHQHGSNGVWHAGEWLDIENCNGTFTSLRRDQCSGCDFQYSCPRSKSRNNASKRSITIPATNAPPGSSSTSVSSASSSSVVEVYDVVIIGAGCIGSAIARELAKYHVASTGTNGSTSTTTNGSSTGTTPLSILLVEAADDVSQGATKGNSGIVHAGYDDKPGSNRAKFCWKGNQMFQQLDKELRFGYQKNGSLVIAMNEKELEELYNLQQRGITNGVQNLRVITDTKELFEMEPYLNPKAIAALYAPDAGNVIPYEFAIALAENAVDNGVELRIRTKVSEIQQQQPPTAAVTAEGDVNFTLTLQQWEPADYIQATQTNSINTSNIVVLTLTLSAIQTVIYESLRKIGVTSYDESPIYFLFVCIAFVIALVDSKVFTMKGNSKPVTKNTPLEELVKLAGEPFGKEPVHPIHVDEMLIGGSGSDTVSGGQIVKQYQIQARNIVNCAGGAADKIANMINDKSFYIKPRIGDYLLLKKSQGHLAKHTIFPCPDPILGKGVLVQTTLWGNLILGPTARDMHDPSAAKMTNAEIQAYILSKCKELVPHFDATQTIHAFAGARAKSSRGDWIIEPSEQNQHMIHVAGIDSPGLAGSPAIALEVVNLIQKDGLVLCPNPDFIKERAPIILPKYGSVGLKMGPVGKYDSDGSNMVQMAANVICKCEKVTELEVVMALRRSLPIDSSQGIRKRTRAGMGNCQASYDNYNCEGRVRAIIARENGIPIEQVGRRPWPATSTLPQRWLSDPDKEQLQNRMNE